MIVNCLLKALQEIWNRTCLGDILSRYRYFVIKGIQLLSVDTYRFSSAVFFQRRFSSFPSDSVCNFMAIGRETTKLIFYNC